MTYDLTEDAKEDLVQIYDFGADTWGSNQAISYYFELHATFSAIADHPTQYPIVDHLGDGIQRCVFRAHSIYFEVSDAGVLILRIAHSQNITRLK